MANRRGSATSLTAHGESERETRRARIDSKLKAQGWKIVPFDPRASLKSYSRHAIAEYPTTSGPADYALVVDGRILCIVEAKRLSLGPQNVLVQAERYSKGINTGPINTQGYRVPFLYATNGEVVWFQDVRYKLDVSRRVAGFHTPAALEEMFARDFEAYCAWFAENPNTHPLLRHIFRKYRNRGMA